MNPSIEKSTSAEGLTNPLADLSVIELVAVSGSLFVMLIGLLFVWQRLKAREQGFGDNSLKAMGLIIFFPTLIVLSVVVEKFETETLAALLGTLAGYIFSRPEGSNSNPPPQSRPEKHDNGLA